MKPGSDIQVLKNAHLSVRQTPQGLEKIVKVEVPPCGTVDFIEGVPYEFEIEFAFEAAPIPMHELSFKRKPCCYFDKAYKCFKELENGLFFRLVDSQRQIWYFYNDTTDYRITATVTFEDEAEVRPHSGVVKVPGPPEDYPKGVTYHIAVEPGATRPFITGDPRSYRLSFHAGPAQVERPLSPGEIFYENKGPDAALCGPDADVFKCFPKDGNGLLFRLVSPARRTWAFYNDTIGTVMQVELWISNEENCTPGPDVHTTVDPARPGMTKLTLTLPPLTTRRMLRGLPGSFELSFVAENADKPMPEKTVQFRYGGPDPKLMRYDQVFSAWKGKDPEDGELYRLVSTKRKQWGFYNDSKNMFLKVQVKFAADKKITPLGETRIEMDRNGDGVWFVVDIPPLVTIKFVEGEYSSYELTLSGTFKKSTRRTFISR
ncbi:unnamed protein product [Phytomonas sp. Hart1]|nr:unnamed protein product [Phytomonas sp. Hart1]|eukprot:CCW67643.1 unnamed protein product [Phytomonas sp. isolate Hart1]